MRRFLMKGMIREDFSMIYFTSDLHLGHRGVIQMCERPFEDVEEMNRTLIAHINARVRKQDTLYILGDIAHRIPVEEVNKMIAQINGKKYLIKGNHDKDYDPSLFEGIYDFLEVNFNGQAISMMHYPMVEWPKSRHGSIHLHGHQHNKPEYNLEQKAIGELRYDVGVDANYFCPVSLNEILAFVQSKGTNV